MTESQQLNPLTIGLSGVNLIEANAGTGKTYSIASLYLRLIATTDMRVDQVLVVSFTEAATAELQERIRARLIELQDQLQSEQLPEAASAFIEEVGGDSDTVLRRVRNAIRMFDQAAIHTIHGFCQQLLADMAFEAGIGFEVQLVTEDWVLRREITERFWREATASATPTWLDYLDMSRFRPRELTRTFATYFTRPEVELLVPDAVDPQQVAALERQFCQALAQFRRLWPAAHAEVAALLQQGKVKYRDASIRCADQLLTEHVQPLRLITGKNQAGFRRLFSKKAPRQNAAMQCAEVLSHAGQQLEQAYSKRLAHLLHELVEFGRDQLLVCKRARRVRHYDDLLNDVYRSLQGPHAQLLLDAVGAQFSAALIDEFQDTDPIQFRIFDRLFAGQGLPVFYVGDPKQAIYSFRNADVYAYLEAREHAGEVFRLTTNRRSVPAIVDGVNRMFSRAPNPFLVNGIDYTPSTACLPASNLTAAPLSPVEWWTIAPGPDDKPLSVGEARQRAAESVATAIVTMLNPPAGSGPVIDASRIAVLVRTHEEGNHVREALARRGVACVQRGNQKVYRTPEARELGLVLAAIINSSSQPTVRAALSTYMLGWAASQLLQLNEDEERWQRVLEQMAGLRDTWMRQGFGRMHRLLMDWFDIEQRLLSLPDGPRRLTNHLHLAEILQAEAARRGNTPDELLAWLRLLGETYDGNDETSLLRLESDENLVQIQTIHNAKGLQYAAVFAPFLWSGNVTRAGYPVFHKGNQVKLDLGTDQLKEHQRSQQRETRAEQIRLSYVALTRAEQVSVAAWGAVSKVADSAIAWLLHSRAKDTIDTLTERVKSLDYGQLIAPLHDLGATVTELPKASPVTLTAPRTERELRARRLGRPLPPAKRVSSFSALVQDPVEQPRDYDAYQPIAAEPGPAVGIAAFPRGARAGRCIHALFENIDFDADPDSIHSVAETVLARHGYPASHAATLTTMARDVVSTPLSGFCLEQVSRRNRVDEMEFYFPTDGLDAAAFCTALEGNINDVSGMAARMLKFDVADGFLHGFIDLVVEHGQRFYIIDYKSNWLGNDVSAYHQQALVTEIARHHYYLQYLIYTVAVHRYLRKRLPGYDYDLHFGGVAYLFVRGMQRDGGATGVFRDRPDYELVAKLERVLGVVDSS